MASGASGIRTREFVLQGALIATWKWPPWQPGRSPGLFKAVCSELSLQLFTWTKSTYVLVSSCQGDLLEGAPPAQRDPSQMLQDVEDLVTHWAMRTFDPLVTLCVKCTHQSTMSTSLQATHICLELQWAHSSVEGHTWCCQVKRRCVQRFHATLTPVIMTAEADPLLFPHHTAT